MKYLTIIASLTLVISADNLQTNELANRQGRFWSWLSGGIGVVRFLNGVCKTSSNLEGTCYTRRQCSTVGGYAGGKCAQNIAVCCISQFSCGVTSSNNNTYFVNPGFPNTFSGGTRCTMTVERCNPDVCQVRIDFLNLILAQPNGDGVCTRDTLVISGGASQVPVICGENTGQHVYVDFNGNANIQITVDINAGVALGRSWNLKVAQIECSSPSRAPSGCLMYYTAASGTVQSFNYGITASGELTSSGNIGTRQLANSNYGICIQPRADQCCIQWRQSSSDSFTVSGNTTDAQTMLGTAAVGVVGSNCSADFVVVPNPSVAGAVDRFCGNSFPTTTTCAKPFVLTSVTNGNDSTLMDGVANRGFSMSYTQQRCSST